MRRLIIPFIFIWITRGVLYAQSSDEIWAIEDTVFIEVPGETIFAVTYAGLDVLSANPLNEGRHNMTVLLKPYDDLSPVVSHTILQPVIDNYQIEAICIRIPGLTTQVIGCFDDSNFILNVAEESITDASIGRLIKNYVGDCIKYIEDFGERKKMREQYIDIHAILNNKEVVKKALENTVKKINRYAPAECISFHPESKAALFRYSAANFIPHWKWALIDLFLAKETKGKYSLNNLKDMDEETSDRLRSDFLKKLDNLTR